MGYMSPSQAGRPGQRPSTARPARLPATRPARGRRPSPAPTQAKRDWISIAAIAIAGLPGVAALIALIFAFQSVKETDTQLQIAQQGQITDRYNAGPEEPGPGPSGSTPRLSDSTSKAGNRAACPDGEPLLRIRAASRPSTPVAGPTEWPDRSVTVTCGQLATSPTWIEVLDTKCRDILIRKRSLIQAKIAPSASAQFRPGISEACSAASYRSGQRAIGFAGPAGTCRRSLPAGRTGRSRRPEPSGALLLLVR
jgi:hypothetical protein